MRGSTAMQWRAPLRSRRQVELLLLLWHSRALPIQDPLLLEGALGTHGQSAPSVLTDNHRRVSGDGAAPICDLYGAPLLQLHQVALQLSVDHFVIDGLSEPVVQ